MTISDIISNVNTFIGDTSEDRVTNDERFQAITEATSWLLEELGNEHMTDRAEIEYLPTVTWYKMDNLTPYLLTAGQLRFKEEDEYFREGDFTRVEPRDLATIPQTRYAYAIEQYNDDVFLGINIPPTEYSSQQDLIEMNVNDGLTYTGINATNIVGEKNAIRFDMENTGVTASGLEVTTETIDISNYDGTGVLVFEFEIPDVDDVTSVSIKLGSDLSSDYFLGTVTQDVNGNALAVGVNTIKVNISDLSTVGSPSLSALTKWSFQINHDVAKTVAEGFKLSDLRIAEPIFLTFKYIFYRVGKDTSGADITEFSATTDVPFFANRYPQYKFAVAHKAAAVLYRSMHDYNAAGREDSEARTSLRRYRKNFSNERDTGSSAFKLAGVSFRGRRRVRRR